MHSEQIVIHDQTFWLSPYRCIYWEEQKSIILSDLHIGKTGHFRKSGIAVPQSIFKEDMQTLVHQIQSYKPENLIVVGDLFHSTENKELDFFKKWRNDFSSLSIQLIKGNHDILSKDWYSAANITVIPKHLSVNNICFVHDITEACNDTGTAPYYISGHIHPCIVLRGLAKQALSLPCYLFTDTYAVLPAFSRFTGGAVIEQKAKDNVYVIINANEKRQQMPAVVKI